MFPGKLALLLIGTPPGQARIIRETLAGASSNLITVTHATRLAEGLALLGHGAFDVVFLDSPLVDASPADAIARVVRSAQRAGIVMLVRPVDVADGHQALAAGAHAFVVKDPVWELDSSRLIRAVEEAIAARRPPARLPAGRLRPARGTVVSFLGASGGCGTTTTALRVALQLAESGLRTALAEVRPFPGGLASLADVAPAGHLGQLLDPDATRPGTARLEEVLTCVTPQLKMVLAPPADRSDRELTADHANRLIDGLRRIAEWVVLDLPCELTASLEVSCLASGLVVVVTETTPASLRQGRRIVELLRGWSIEASRIGAVAIHRGTDRIADPRNIEKTLGCDLLAVLPITPGTWSVAAHRDPAAQKLETELLKPVLQAFAGRLDCPPSIQVSP